MKIAFLALGVKRIFDFCLTLLISLVTLPVVLVTMMVIKMVSPKGSVLFKQERIGYQLRPFTIYKLRTMSNERNAKGELLPDEARLKKWGRVIRKLSIDELGQIVNILRGQMAWIGPRPLLPHEMSVMTVEEQTLRQSMLPGITGWEAVNERRSSTRTEMVKYDLFYVNNWSIALDFKIFFKTIAMLFTGHRADDAHRAPKVREDEIKNNDANGQ